MEAIVEPLRASTPGDTCASPLCAMYARAIPAVVFLNLHTPPLLICFMHLVRANYEQACVGMVYIEGLAWKLLWSLNGPVICACLVRRPYVSLLLVVGVF